MTNKKIWTYAIVAAAVILTGIFLLNSRSPLGQPKELKEIKIATQPAVFYNFPVFLAQEKGFFAKNGLIAKFEQISAGIAVSALLAKDIDYSTYVNGATVASQTGVPIKTVMAFTDKPLLFLIIRPGLELKDMKLVGLAGRFSPATYLTQKLIKENGISCEVVFLENELATNAQLSNGTIDAALSLNTVAISKFQGEGFGVSRIFEDSDMIFGGLVATDEKIKNSPEEIAKVAKSVQDAIKFIKTKPQETKELIFEYFGLENNEANKKIADDAYSIFAQYLLDKGVPRENGINKLIQYVKAGQFKSFEDVDNQTVSAEDINKSFDFNFLSSK